VFRSIVLCMHTVTPCPAYVCSVATHNEPVAVLNIFYMWETLLVLIITCSYENISRHQDYKRRFILSSLTTSLYVSKIFCGNVLT